MIPKTFYNSLGGLGQIGCTLEPEPATKSVGGSHLPLCIKGQLHNKTKTLFKPRIPKKPGETVHLGVLIRAIGSFNYLYDFNTSIFIASLHISKDARTWIDTNIDEIQRRVHETCNSRS